MRYSLSVNSPCLVSRRLCSDFFECWDRETANSRRKQPFKRCLTFAPSRRSPGAALPTQETDFFPKKTQSRRKIEKEAVKFSTTNNPAAGNINRGAPKRTHLSTSLNWRLPWRRPTPSPRSKTLDTSGLRSASLIESRVSLTSFTVNLPRPVRRRSSEPTRGNGEKARESVREGETVQRERSPDVHHRHSFTDSFL